MCQPKTPEPEFVAALESAIRASGLTVSAPALEKLARHYSLLRLWNQRLNLTRIVEPGDAARFHYAESLFAAPLVADARSILDVGSGAGFPAVPLAVVRTDVNVAALESNQKKAVFLKEVKEQLALENLEVLRTRIEDHQTSGYDVIALRALDRAQEMALEIVRQLGKDQRLLLFCTESLLERIRKGAAGLQSRIHPIPNSRERLIVLFSPAENG